MALHLDLSWDRMLVLLFSVLLVNLMAQLLMVPRKAGSLARRLVFHYKLCLYIAHNKKRVTELGQNLGSRCISVWQANLAPEFIYNTMSLNTNISI